MRDLEIEFKTGKTLEIQEEKENVSSIAIEKTPTIDLDISSTNEMNIEINQEKSFDIDISNKVQEITPALVNLEVNPSSETQIFNHDGEYGYDQVKVNGVDIPTKTSDLINDSNFVSDDNYVHTDNNYTTTEKNKLAGLNNFSGNASDVFYEDNVGYGVDNVQDALDEAFNSLDSKAGSGELDNLVSYSINQNKNDTQKTRARKNIEAKRDVINLGEIDLADYNDDFDTFMNTLINEGEYKFDNDVFTYYVTIIELGNFEIGQEYCSSEEGYALRYFRTIYLDNTGNFDYAINWDNFITFATANNTYAPKNHVHYKILNTASTIKTYLDTFNQYGEFSITSTPDKEKYWVFTDYYNVTVNGKSEYRRIQRYYSISEPWKIYSRYGLYNNTTKKINFDEWYVNEGVIE